MELLAIGVQEIGVIVGTVAVIIGTLYAVAKLPPVKFIFRKLFQDPFMEVVRTSVTEATKESKDEMHRFAKYVREHLGPDGNARPIYKRLKNAERYISLANLRQRRMLDTINVGIAESDAEGNNTFVNKFLCDLLGIEPRDWEGRGWERFIHPDERQVEVDQFERQTVDGSARDRFRTSHLLHKDGHVVVTKTRNYPLEVDGEIVGWVAEIFSTDDNEQIIGAQDELSKKLDFLVDHVAKNSAKIDALQSAVPVATYRSDAEGVTIDSNDVYLELFDLEPSEISTPKWITRLDPRGLEETLQRIENVFKLHKSFSYDNKLRDGRYLRFSGNPIFEGGEFTGYVGIIAVIPEKDAVNLPKGVN